MPVVWILVVVLGLGSASALGYHATYGVSFLSGYIDCKNCTQDIEGSSTPSSILY